jgi:hypothetical protein
MSEMRKWKISSTPIISEYHVENVRRKDELGHHFLEVIVPEHDTILDEHRILTTTHQGHNVRAAVRLCNRNPFAEICTSDQEKKKESYLS